jgi:hypothetical protein
VTRTPTRRSLLAVLFVGAMMAALSTCTPRTPPTPTPARPGTVKLRYGPFTIPAADQPGTGLSFAQPLLGLTPEKGMIWNQPVAGVAVPCQDCYLTRMVAGLEYQNGSDANISNGAWLHHMVLMNQGQGRSDPTCAGNPFSLPHVAVGASPGNSERIFASGNERTELRAPAGSNAGYKVNAGDKFNLLVDLMNTTLAAKQVYLTMTYDYVPGNTPGYRTVKPVWLDVNQCGVSEVPAKTGAYQLKSVPWRSTVAGQIIGAGGHLHDGGVHETIETNGQAWCDEATKYGTKPGYVESGEGMDHGDGGMDHGMPMDHISEHPVCRPPLPTLKVGDTLGITGYYDDSVHPQMMHEGKLHNVMAIAIIYVAQ